MSLSHYLTRWGFFKTILIIGITMGIGIGLRWIIFELYNPAVFPIRKIQIVGDYQYVDPLKLQRIIMPYLKESFIMLHTKRLEKEIMQLPWVAGVQVHRYWPSTVKIYLDEHVPVAIWKEKFLLDDQGRVFFVSPIPKKLPIFLGLEGQEKLMVQHYKDMQLILDKVGLEISKMYLDARLAWTVELNNSMRVILGRQDDILRLQHFASIYHSVFAIHMQEIDYVDMRYFNAMAVHWKKQQPLLNNLSAA